MFLPSIHSLVRIAQFAGAPIRDHFRLTNQSTLKSDNTPVSEVDLAVHERFLNWICGFPHVGYIGEEGDAFHPSHSYALYVDPLDGTSAYLRGIAAATVAVSLMHRLDDTWWEPMSSVIHDPINEWTWSATKGGKGFVQHGSKGGQIPSAVRYPQQLWKVTAVAWRNAPCKLEAIREALQQRSEMEHQSFGATAIGGGLIASGLTDAVLFGGRSAVETAAMSLIVRSAGGVATDLSGTPLEAYELIEHNGKFDFLLPKGSIMSSCQTLTDRLVEIVKQVQ